MEPPWSLSMLSLVVRPTVAPPCLNKGNGLLLRSSFLFLPQPRLYLTWRAHLSVTVFSSSFSVLYQFYLGIQPLNLREKRKNDFSFPPQRLFFLLLAPCLTLSLVWDLFSSCVLWWEGEMGENGWTSLSAFGCSLDSYCLWFYVRGPDAVALQRWIQREGGRAPPSKEWHAMTCHCHGWAGSSSLLWKVWKWKC